MVMVKESEVRGSEPGTSKERITKRNLIDALENIRYTTAIADIEEYDSFYLALEDLENL